MKNIIHNLCGLGLLCMLAAVFTACEKDTDSNPVLNTKDLTMTLLQPTYPSSVLLDLSTSETVNLKVKEQPAYGYPAVTVYSVQVSIDPAFLSVSPSVADPSVKYTTLESTYTRADMKVDAMELNNAIIKMYQSANNGADPTGKVLDAYVRVKAQVYRAEGTDCYSNVVKLSNVTVAYVAAIPKTVYLSGSSVKGGSGAKEWGPVYGSEGAFYTIAYFGSGDTFLWGDSEETGTGYSRTSSVDDQANAGVEEAEDGSFRVTNAGWYVLYLTTAVDKTHNALLSDLTLYPGRAYVIGRACGAGSDGNGFWTDSAPEWEMTAPAEANGMWVSPAFITSGELRAYIKVPGVEWWHTEFTLLKGKIFWRTGNIISNWAENIGAAYSVACEPGQHLYINFDELTGEVK